MGIAAQDLRFWSPGSTSLDQELLRQKIRSLLHVAAAAGHVALVLGALGTGAFENDPAIVSRVFSELLKTEFAGRFRVVAFAIIFSDTNIKAFSEHFPLIEAPEAERFESLRIAAFSAATR